MAEGKKSIVVYAEWHELFDSLEDEEAGRLIKHFFKYVNDLNPVADRATELLFIQIKQTLKRDLEKWDKTIEKRREAGRASADARKSTRVENEATKSTHVKSVESNSTKSTVSVNVNDSVNVNENVIKKERLLPPPPPIDEVIAYFKENGYSEQSARKAFDYYQASVTETKRHWSDGKGNPIKNWKMKMQSVWFKDENKEPEKTGNESRNNQQGNLRYASPIL